MLAREGLREGVGVFGDELKELQQHARAALRVRVAPLGLRYHRVCDRGIHFVLIRERNPRLHLTGARIEDVAKATGCPGPMLPANEMGEFARHVRHPFRVNATPVGPLCAAARSRARA